MVATFGRRLRSARETNGLTVRELGHRSGVHYSLISHVEAGTKSVSVENLVRLAQTLGVSTDHLLGLTS